MSADVMGTLTSISRGNPISRSSVRHVIVHRQHQQHLLALGQLAAPDGRTWLRKRPEFLEGRAAATRCRVRPAVRPRTASPAPCLRAARPGSSRASACRRCRAVSRRASVDHADVSDHGIRDSPELQMVAGDRRGRSREIIPAWASCPIAGAAAGSPADSSAAGTAPGEASVSVGVSWAWSLAVSRSAAACSISPGPAWPCALSAQP